MLLSVDVFALQISAKLMLVLLDNRWIYRKFDYEGCGRMGETPKRNRYKKNLNITVSDGIRELLNRLSEDRGMSVSAMVEEWAKDEAVRLRVDRVSVASTLRAKK